MALEIAVVPEYNRVEGMGRRLPVVDGGRRSAPARQTRERRDLAKYPDAAKHGGGSAWTTPAFDPATGTLFVGTGNPSQQMEDVSRPGLWRCPAGTVVAMTSFNRLAALCPHSVAYVEGSTRTSS
jgi:glucose dehydrogenase